MNIVTSSDSKALINVLITAINSQQESIFTNTLLVVPSKYYADKIVNLASQRNGVISNLKTLFIEQFLDLLLHATKINKASYCSSSQLAWLYYQLIQSDKDIQELSAIFTADKPKHEIFSFAKNLASLLDSYLLHDKAIIQQFEAVDNLSRDKKLEFDLQKKLYLKASSILNAKQKRLSTNKWDDVLEKFSQTNQNSTICQLQPFLSAQQIQFKKVFIFGFNNPYKFFLNFVQQLSFKTDVSFDYYFQSTCDHYWADANNKESLIANLANASANSPSKNQINKDNENHPKQDSLDFDENDNSQYGLRDFSIAVNNQDNLLLLSLAMGAKKMQQKLFQLNIDFDQDSFITKQSNHTKKSKIQTLLQSIQTDIFTNRQPDIQSDNLAKINNQHLSDESKSLMQSQAKDHSIKIFSCHNILREVETIKQEILHKLHNESSLNLDDFLLVTTANQSYVPYLDLVFNKTTPQLKLNLYQPANQHEAAKFLSVLFSTTNNQLNKMNMFELLESHLVANCFFDDNHDLIKELIIFINNNDCTIQLLKSNKPSKGFLEKHEIASWQDFILFLWQKYFYLRYEKNISQHNQVEYLNQSDLSFLLPFSNFIKFLIESQNLITSLDNLHDLNKLFAYLDSELKERNSYRAEIDAIIKQWTEETQLTELAGESPLSIDAKLIQTWLLNKITATASTRSSLNINLLSLNSEQSISAKHIYILGANKATIPTRKHTDSNNLTPSTSDNHPSNFELGEKLSFMMLLLNSEESFNISFIGQDLYSKDRVEPAIAVQELLQYVYFFYGDKLPIIYTSLNKFLTQDSATNHHLINNLRLNNSFDNQTINFQQDENLSLASKLWFNGNVNHLDKTSNQTQSENIEQLKQEFLTLPNKEQVQQLIAIGKLADKQFNLNSDLVVDLKHSFNPEQIFDNLADLEKFDILSLCSYYWLNNQLDKLNHALAQQKKQNLFKYQEFAIDSILNLFADLQIDTQNGSETHYYYLHSKNNYKILQAMIMHIYNLENLADSEHLKAFNQAKQPATTLDQIKANAIFYNKSTNKIQALDLCFESLDQISQIKQEIICSFIYLKSLTHEYFNFSDFINQLTHDKITTQDINQQTNTAADNLKQVIISNKFKLKPDLVFYQKSVRINAIEQDLKLQLKTTLDFLLGLSTKK